MGDRPATWDGPCVHHTFRPPPKAGILALVTAYIATGGVVTLLLATFIYMSERHGLLSCDRFATTAHRWAAYGWFAIFLYVLTLLTVAASQNPTRVEALENVPFWTLFATHVLLLIFLGGWWLLSGMPDLRSFVNLQKTDGMNATLVGIAVGVGGWFATITLAMIVGMVLFALDLVDKDVRPSPMIPYMAGLPLWQKAIIVFMAMTVEEFFFRGWLQKRVGLVFSTIIFALAHAGYGQPMMLIGVTIVSFIIGYTFYRTRNLWPCIIAHGVFDAIQLFVVVPLAVRFMGLG